MITLGNVAWWRVDMPDRNEDGELVTVPVRMKFRLYTRHELREQFTQQAQGFAQRLQTAQQALAAAETTEAVQAAGADMGSAVDTLLEAEGKQDREVADRVIDWRAEDVSGEAFTPDLLAQLLSDQARFRAVSQALLDASNGAPRKN